MKIGVRKLTKDNYLSNIVKILSDKDLEPLLEWQLINIFQSLLAFYSIEYTQKLLSELLLANQSLEKLDHG